MRRAPELLRFWFGFDRPVDRRAYLLSGLALAPLKLAGDVALVWALEGVLWAPAQFLSPFLGSRLPGATASTTLLALGVWSLPFLWIGLSMTYRRAVDAGAPGGMALLFFVPVVNYLLIAALCALPSRLGVSGERRPLFDRLPAWRHALLAGGLGASVGLAAFACSLAFRGGYSSALFVGAPFALGFVAAATYRARRPESPAPSPATVAQLALLFAGGALVLTAAEGLLCLAMAYPLAAVLAWLGSILGGLPTARWRAAAVVAALAPLMAAMLPPEESPLREVVTTTEIDAPPEVVWRNVTAFSELPPPREWFFAAGIAYPVRARYEGEGAGAVRYCEFSTGPFVEPITRWEEPRRLSFDVAAQPPTMEEWSPYRDLSPPHLLDGLEAVRGEFRLVRRPDGGTHLEGSTWYRLRLFPQAYWTLWSDALIHGIHRRVLDHVETLSEAS